jgi:hypothetical protein
MSPARFDSVAYCRFDGLGFWGAKDCVVARNTITGDVQFVANQGRPCYTGTTLDPLCTTNSERDTLRYNRIDLGIMGPNRRAFEFKAWTQSCLIDSNRVTGTFDNNGSTDTNNGIAMVSYNSYYQTFRDNHWEYEATSAHHLGSPWDAIYLRDSLHTTTFERDTIVGGAHSSSSIAIRAVMSASGSFSGSNRNVTWRKCIIRITGDIFFQDSFNGWIIDDCTFASAVGTPFFMICPWNSSKIRHTAFWAQGEAFRIEGSSTITRFTGTGNELTSCAFYSTSASTKSAWGGVTQFMGSSSGCTSNNNLFFTPGYDSSPGDRSLVWDAYLSSKPGAGQPWNQATGQDAASKHASPLWVDSTFTSLDTRLRPGSPAIGMGVGGSDAGPYPFSAGATDLVPPAAVSDLRLSLPTDRGMVVAWTAPGDDGATGTATTYDLRYSTSPITSGNFATATRVAVPPVPGAAGTAQSYVMTGLNPSTTYYLALRTVDEAGNWSSMSNVPGMATAADTTPPARVTDLSTP